MKHRPPTARNAGSAKVVLPVAVLVILVGVGVGVYVAFKHFQHQGLKEAARAPKDSTAVLAFDHPRETLAESIKSTKELADESEDFEKQWERFIEEAKENLGFDPSDLDAYAEAGFDLDKPLTIAILALGKYMDPEGVVIGVGITDPKAAMETIEKLADKNKLIIEEDAGQPTLHLVKRKNRKTAEMVVATVDGRMFISFGSHRDKEDDLVDRTREFFQAREGDNLAGTEAFQTTVGRLSGGGVFSGYVNLQDIFDKLRKRDRVDLMEDFKAVGFSSGKNSGSAFVHLNPSSKLDEYLQPGSDCRDLLSRMDKPLLAFTVSLGQLGDLSKYLTEKTMSEKDLDRFHSEFERELGMEFDEMAELWGGAGGVCVYGPDEKRGEPRVLVFFKVKDDEKGKKIAKETVWKIIGRGDGPEEKEVDGGFLYTSERYASAMVDGYVVVGNATKQIKKLAKGDGEGWSPACGGRDVAAYEVFISDAVDKFSEDMPKEIKKMFKKVTGDDAYAFSRISDVDEEGIKAVYESRGASSVSLYLMATATAFLGVSRAVPMKKKRRKWKSKAKTKTAWKTGKRAWKTEDGDWSEPRKIDRHQEQLDRIVDVESDSLGRKPDKRSKTGR